jgi:phosphoglycolate phosphatase-like HAD superfamily hydrolase
MMDMSKIYIFDFDDTLVKTTSYIYVKKRCGGEIKLSSREYACYKCKSNEEYCFRDFDTLVNPTPYKLMNVFRRVVRKYNGDKVYILTARPQIIESHIHNYLKTIGIKHHIPVVGLGSSEPYSKANWIVSKLDELDNVEEVYFADDSIKNINAVNEALSKKNIRYRTQHVK